MDSNSSLQVIDPKASAAPPWSVVMSATAARLTSDLLDGQGMLTVELTVVLAARLSTAVQGDTPWTTRDLMMLIAAAHRYACAVSVQTCGSCSIKR